MSILIHSAEPSFGPRYFIGLDAGIPYGLAVWDAEGQRFAREDAPAVWDALVTAGLERQGYRVCRVRPRSRKLSADVFRRLTRYQGRTSQHARDAAMLVFGLKNVPPETLGQVTLALYEGPSPPE